MSGQIKKMWREACFKRVDAPSATNAKKRSWEPTDAWMPLRRFAGNLVAEGNGIAKEWFAHKFGSLNADQTDANKRSASEASAATRLARRKSKSGASTATVEKAAKGKASKGL